MGVPIFSIIIPIFNRQNYLEFSINSVQNQKFTDFELICIDDGSTDQSLKKIKDFQQKDGRIKIIEFQENQGRCIARNKGIQLAKGEWICFLDSDDEYLLNHLSFLHQQIEKNKSVLALATEQTIHHKKQKPYKKKSPYPLELKDFIHSNPLQLNQLCINKKLGVYFPEENIPISEDWLFFRTLLTKTNILKFNETTCNLNEHEQRTMNTSKAMEIAKWNHYTGKYFIENYEVEPSIKSKIAAHTELLCANILLSAGDKQHARPYFKNAMKYSNSLVNPLFYKAIIKFLKPNF